MAITAFLSRSSGLLNRGPGGPGSLGAGSLYSIFSSSITSRAPSYIIVRHPPSCGRHESYSFNPSTFKVISWYSSTGRTCYLHRCISYFSSLAGVNMLQLPWKAHWISTQLTTDSQTTTAPIDTTFKIRYFLAIQKFSLPLEWWYLSKLLRHLIMIITRVPNFHHIFILPQSNWWHDMSWLYFI